VGCVAESGGLLEGGDLGVVALVVEVCALADDVAVEGEDAAYGGVGRSEAAGLVGQI